MELGPRGRSKQVQMKVLFVTPVEDGSGETITSLHLAEGLTQKGHDVLFLASQFAARLLGDRFANQIRILGKDGPENHTLWDSMLAEFAPDVVLFADYPLMFFGAGSVPLAFEPGWRESLDSLPMPLVTLDHFGFAQKEMGMFFGPPHLSFHYQKFPSIPTRMQILLPCPMHEPTQVDGRRGDAVRYWNLPIEPPQASRAEIRSRFLSSPDDYLIFHSVPNWACTQAERMGLFLYQHLGKILDYYLRELHRPVTVVSVNNGSLLEAPADSCIRIVNLEPLLRPEFENLLFHSDLVMTENSVSIAMGKAICGLQPCCVLRNSFTFRQAVDHADGPIRDLVLEMEDERIGSIFPFNVYPIGMVQELEQLILYRNNSLTAGFQPLEIFGGSVTRQKLNMLLTDSRERELLKAAQLEYVRRLEQIGDGAEVLEAIVDRAKSPAQQ
jgi:Family of unknown function (DUF6365)